MSAEHAKNMARYAAQMGVTRMGVWHPNKDLGYLTWQEALAAVAKTAYADPHVGILKIGPDVTNLVGRSPRELVNDLIELKSLRLEARGIHGSHLNVGGSGLWVGLGRGDSALAAKVEPGMPARRPMTARQLVLEALEVVRLLDRTGLDVDVSVSAHGPLMLRTIAELDTKHRLGIILGTGFDESTLTFVEDTLGRKLATIENLMLNPAAFDFGPRKWNNLFTIAQASHHLFRAVDQVHPETGARFVPEEYAEGVKAVYKAYPIDKHGHLSTEDRDQLRRIAVEQGKGWIDYMTNRYCLVGTHDVLPDRLARLWERGVRGVSIPAFGSYRRVERCMAAVQAAEDILNPEFTPERTAMRFEGQDSDTPVHDFSSRSDSVPLAPPNGLTF